MNIYEKIYTVLLAIIICILFAIYLDQKQSHKDTTAFTNWLQTNYSIYEEDSNEK